MQFSYLLTNNRKCVHAAFAKVQKVKVKFKDIRSLDDTPNKFRSAAIAANTYLLKLKF